MKMCEMFREEEKNQLKNVGFLLCQQLLKEKLHFTAGRSF